MAYERFQIRLDPIWRPVLAFPFAATEDRSYVELENGQLTFRFGWLFHERFPIADVESARAASWSLLGGIGWRTNFVSGIGLIGSTRGIVEVRLSKKRWVRMPFPLRCNQISVSLEEPDAFLIALTAARRLSL